MTKHPAALSLLALALSTGVLAAGAPAALAQADPNPVVARYTRPGGAVEVRRDAFETAFRLFAAQLLNERGVPYSLETQAQLDGLRPQALEQFVREEVLIGAAGRAGVAPEAAAVEAQLAGVRAQLPDPAARNAALEGVGIKGEAEYRRLVERGLTVGNFARRFTERAVFGDAVVASVYRANRDQFNREAQACAAHILVATEPEASAALARLAAGEAFATVAREVSKDPGSAAQGGELGCLERGQTVPTFDQAIFEGPVGVVQGPVPSQFGFHLIRVARRNPAGIAPVEEVAGSIRERLAERAFELYVDRLVARSAVQTFPDQLGSTKQ